MTVSDEDRTRIVEAMALAIYDADGPFDPTYKIFASAALDAALSAGLAEAIRAKALEDAAEVVTALVDAAILALREKEKEPNG